MKHALSLLIAFALPIAAAEQFRTWTSTDGRTMEAKLLDKTETSAKFLLETSQRAELSLDKLSRADREYIREADVLPDPSMEVGTKALDSNETNSKDDARRVQVKLTDLRGRRYELVIHWLGPKSKTVGVWKTEKKKISEDAVIDFRVLYDKSGVGSEYKGYVVGLRDLDADPDVDEVWVAKSASQKPFERFLGPQ